ncbi:telomere repeats-binding bouquet formation protein 1 [Pithys albifrons albifrons]|uniref:telomere repeats-binding bouquet formation protein 1 n=1 Tax=Pithys albifrons albifrons TaxID=3385563 RepID=UPI003A5CF607
MDTQNVQKNQCDMKTDLNLLLECLKYQMDCPLSQKEALITIYSICQQNSEASEYFREIGGLMFINDLAKSSAHCIVKEAALFTLGIIIESNVYCQQTLCTSALFEDLILFLINKDSGVNLKRMSVYVILVLVSNNRSGQAHVRNTGCLTLLLQLFRTVLSTCGMAVPEGIPEQRYELWSSVCSALCACVNNPQNEDNQNICCSVFPYAKECLESCTEPEIVRPLCSFLGLTVANNLFVQKYFVSIGGLDTLARVLLEIMHNPCLSQSGTKLAVVVTKTLDACIANNSATGAVLARYHTVSGLLNLLASETLNTGEKVSVILTIGHCTEVCEENQCELLQNNGLPLMIQVLTESQDEELIKAATFVLQNCKQMTEQLSLKINDNSLNVSSAEELDVQVRKRSLQDYWKKAKEILHRIKLIEQEHDEVGLFTKLVGISGKFLVTAPPTPSAAALLSPGLSVQAAIGFPFTVSLLCPVNLVTRLIQHFCRACTVTDWCFSIQGGVQGGVFVDDSEALKSHEVNPADLKAYLERAHKEDNRPLRLQLVPSLSCPARETEAVTAVGAAPAGQRGQISVPCAPGELPTDRALHTHSANGNAACATNQAAPQASEQLLEHPAEPVRNGKQTCTSDQNSSYSEITRKHKSTSAPSSSHKMASSRCSGCVAGGLSFNSKTFTRVLRSCLHRCDHHRVLLEAEERHRKELRRLALCNSYRYTTQEEILLTPVKKDRLHTETSTWSKKESFQSILLTPSRKAKPCTPNREEYHKNTGWTGSYSLTPACGKALQKPQDAELKRQGVREMCNLKCQHVKENCSHSLDKDKSNELCSLDMNTRTLNKRRRTRKDFTSEEITCLLDGVKEMGNHWNLILWSYPFQKGRTSVDLAKKYYRLQKQFQSRSRSRSRRVPALRSATRQQGALRPHLGGAGCAERGPGRAGAVLSAGRAGPGGSERGAGRAGAVLSAGPGRAGAVLSAGRAGPGGAERGAGPGRGGAERGAGRAGAVLSAGRAGPGGAERGAGRAGAVLSAGPGRAGAVLSAGRARQGLC